MAEEPYEWYESGLSEDGTINLEAPRKWRLLKERTGHGAFYGMHIVIYGDCIAPRLVCFLCHCLHFFCIKFTFRIDIIIKFFSYLVGSIVVCSLYCN